MSSHNISVDQTRQLLADEDVTVLDIRDAESYAQAHIEAALHIENINVENFVADTDKDKPLIVYCFHGNASQSAAAYFEEHGFNRVYSMDGGFAAWPGA